MKKLFSILGLILVTVYSAEQDSHPFVTPAGPHVIKTIIEEFDNSPARIAAIVRYLKEDGSPVGRVKKPLFRPAVLNFDDQVSEQPDLSIALQAYPEQGAILAPLAHALFGESSDVSMSLGDDYSSINSGQAGSVESSKPAAVDSKPLKRKYERQQPERDQYKTDEEFDAAWQTWRDRRDRNNKAVNKSRGQDRS